MSGVTITMAMTLKAELADAFCSGLPAMIEDTAKRPGFRDIRIVRHKDDPARLIFIETWDSEQAYHDYIAWRTARGDMDSMQQLLAAPPQLDVWPALIVAR